MALGKTFFQQFQQLRAVRALLIRFRLFHRWPADVPEVAAESK
jgi:hypothetical protein